MFGCSLSLLIGSSSHLQRWDRSYFCENYHPSNVPGELGLVAPIITFKFLQDNRPFLLGAIGASTSSPLPFQVHLRWAHDLLGPFA
jgi:hypothetical protein